MDFNLECNNKGVTLVELLVTLAVVSIIMMVVYILYAAYTRSYTVQNVTADVQQSIRVGMAFMAQDIRLAGFAPTEGAVFGIEEASGTKVRFTRDTIDNTASPPDYNGVVNDKASERITYTYNAGTGQLVRIEDESTADEFRLVLLDNVNTLSFAYFDEAENNLGLPVSAANLENIRSVEITLTVQEPAGRDRQVARTTTQRVLCRNLGL